MNLASEIRKVEPFSERFHIDVADGHYVRNMIFFPDQVKAIRRCTKLPLEVHLMVSDPLVWVEPFVEAGADIIIFCFDSTENPGEVLRAIRSSGKKAGVSLLINESLDLVAGLWEELDVLTIVGTAMGIKGATMDASVPEKILTARKTVMQRSLSTEVEADGGIRRDTVPQLKRAGADFIVPGSLMFKEDPAEMRQWLKSL